MAQTTPENSPDIPQEQGNLLVEYKKNPSMSLPEAFELIRSAPGYGDVIEWTFLYDEGSKESGTPYNTTFFEKIGGVSYSDFKIRKIKPEQLQTQVEEKFTTVISLLEILKGRLSEAEDEKTSSEVRENKKALLEEGIDTYIQILKAAKLAVPIELEKALPEEEMLLSDEERNNRAMGIFDLQQKIYNAKPVSKDPTEAIRSMKLLCEEYQRAKKEGYLSSEELESYRAYYLQIRSFLIRKEYAERDLPPGNIEDYTSPSTKTQESYTKDVLERFGDIVFPKKVYMELWQIFIRSMGLPQNVEENPTVGSIYDAPNHLYVPTNSAYAQKTLKDVLLLMIHEISSHGVNQKISENAGLAVRLAGTMDKEEGLAILMEHVFKGFSLNEYTNAGIASPYMLATEFMSQEDRRKFVNLRVKIFNKDQTKGDTHNTRDLRVMRGFPLNSHFYQLKDRSYVNGAFKILDAMKEHDLHLGDFFMGKVGIDHIIRGKLKGIVQEEDRLAPYFFPDLIIFLLGRNLSGLPNDVEFKEAEPSHSGIFTDFQAFLMKKYTGGDGLHPFTEGYIRSVTSITWTHRMSFLLILELFMKDPKFFQMSRTGSSDSENSGIPGYPGDALSSNEYNEILSKENGLQGRVV